MSEDTKVEVIDASTQNSADVLLEKDDAAFAESLGLESTGFPKKEAVPPRTPSEKKSAGVEARREKANVPMDQAAEDFGATTPKTNKMFEPEKVEEAPVVTEVPKEEEVVEEVKEEEKPLLTKFAVHQGEEEIEVPTDLRFSFTANKKEYKDVPIDKVVLWAQMGVYNEALQEEVRASKQFVNETLTENQQLRQVAETLRTNQEDLLGNAELYEEARERWLAHNTPEERARRAERQLQTERAVEAQRQTDAAGASYITTQIYPVLEQMLQNNNRVSEDEVLGRFNRIITPYLVNGRVPTQRLPEVKQLVERDLAHYVTSLQLDRDTTEKRQTQATDTAVQVERTKAALAKRQAAKALKPKGTAVKETPKQTTYKSAEDWASRALDDILTPVG